MNSIVEINNKRNQYKSTIAYLRKLKLEFCIPLFIERNIKIEDIQRFTIDDFKRYNINEVVASVLLEGDETEVLLIMIKEHYDPRRIQDAINTIHEEHMTITKNNLYRELNNDNLSHPQKLRELQSILDKGGNGDINKERQKEIEKAKREEIDGMKNRMKNECAICMEKIATHIYSGCGHLSICKECADDYQDICVVCREAGHPIEVKFPKIPK